MRNVRIRPIAQLDLESMYIYGAFEMGQPKAARALLDAFYDAFDRIAALPEAGMLFADDDLGREYHRMLVKSHWVYYTFDESSVVIWRIFHTRQDIANYTFVDL